MHLLFHLVVRLTYQLFFFNGETVCSLSNPDPQTPDSGTSLVPRLLPSPPLWSSGSHTLDFAGVGGASDPHYHDTGERNTLSRLQGDRSCLKDFAERCFVRFDAQKKCSYWKTCISEESWKVLSPEVVFSPSPQNSEFRARTSTSLSPPEPSWRGGLWIDPGF